MISYYTEDSIGCQSNSYIKARKYILNKYYTDIAKVGKRLLSYHYHILAKRLFFNSNYGEARKYFLKSFTTNPKSIKSLISFMMSYIGIKPYKRMGSFWANLKNKWVNQ